MATYNTTAKHNDALLDVKYTIDFQEREFSIEKIYYYGINVLPLLSEIDIENLTEQIRKDNE